MALQHSIGYDQNGAVVAIANPPFTTGLTSQSAQGPVWTGTTTGGLGAPGAQLGAANVNFGASCPPSNLTCLSDGTNPFLTGDWYHIATQANTFSSRLYAISVTVAADTTAPTAAPTASPAANGAGWNNTDVTVAWNWTDNSGGSGIDSSNCTTSSVTSGEGGSVTVNATCKDVAGNQGSASYTVKVDKTNPTISAGATNADATVYSPGAWSNQTVTVHYTCNDTLSGVASCTADQIFSADTSSSTFGTAKDVAGNQASSSPMLVRVDKTKPSIVAAITAGTLGTGGVYTSNVTVHFTCSDSGSGIPANACPADQVLSAEGPSISSTAQTVTDAAGNISDPSNVITVAINKTATVTLGNLAVTYNGAAQAATATTAPAGLTVNFTYNGSSTAPTAAGSYTVVGTVSDPTYHGSATGTMVISQATATVTLGNLTQTYTGNALSPSVTTTPTGLAFTLTGAPSTNAGSYPVSATINDPNYTGSATGTFVINRATATVTLGNLTQTYTGSALSPSVTTTPTGLAFTMTGAPNTNAGSYAVSATINDPNYTGSASGTFVINRATATVTLGNLTQTYTGSALSPSVTTTPTGLAYTLTGAPNTNAGSYPVSATINDPNYTGSATGTFVINRATATVTLGNLTQTYTGSALSPSVTTTPTGLAFPMTGAPNTNAGSYPVSATINDPNYTGTASGTFVINQAQASVTLGNLTQSYTGSALSPSVTTTPTGLAFTMTGAPNTNAGSYPVSATISDPNYTGSATGTFVINRATATVTLGNLSQTYTGSALSPSVTTTPTGLAFTMTGAPNTNAGSYPVSATINDPNYTGSASGTFVINRATATVALGNLAQSYTGSALSPSVNTTPTGLAFTMTGASDTNAGSYPVSATINDPNYTGSASGTFVINQAQASVTFGNLTQTYTGGALSPSVNTTPTGLAFTMTGAPNTNAGSYPVSATINDPNYTGTASGTFVINRATATVTLGNLSPSYTGSAQAATVVTNPAGLNVTLTYNGSSTAPTVPGNYIVVATVNDTNYTGTASGTMTISRATAQVALGSLSATYNGAAHTATATTNPAGLNVTLTYNGNAAAPTAAGNYTVVATINDPDYSGSATGTLNIAQAQIQASAGGSSGTYDGTVHPTSACVVTGAYTGGLTCTNSLTAVGPSVGSGVITPVIAANPNFAVSTTNGAWAITPKAASVTPNAASKTYGTSDPTLTGTLAGFVASDNITATYTRTAGEAVGSYTISAQLAPASLLGNYTITYNTAAFKIGIGYGLYVTKAGCDSLDMSGQAMTDSYSSTGTYAATKLNSGGDVWIYGNVGMSGQATINGKLYSPTPSAGPCSTSGATLSGQASVTGGYALYTPMTFASPGPITAGTTSLNISKSTALPGPGSYGDVQVSGGNTVLTLPPGTYTFNSLVLSGGAQILVSPAGPLTINIAGKTSTGADQANPLDLSGGSVAGLNGLPVNFTIRYGGAASLNLTGNADVTGVLYAPSASAQLTGKGGWFGSMVVGSLKISGQGALHYDRTLGQ